MSFGMRHTANLRQHKREKPEECGGGGGRSTESRREKAIDIHRHLKKAGEVEKAEITLA